MENLLNDLTSIAGANVNVNKYSFMPTWKAVLRIDTDAFKAEFVEEGDSPYDAVVKLHGRAIAYFNNGLKELSMRLIEGPSAE